MRFFVALVFCSLFLSSGYVTAANEGEQIYQRFCSSCHSASADTDSIWYPSLTRIVQTSEPEELVRMIDSGQFRRAGETQSGSDFDHPIPFMPSWSWLSDRELMNLVNYLTMNIHDEYVPLSTLEVRALRDPGTASALSGSERQAANHIYLQHCAGCHGVRREGVVGPPLSRWPLETLSIEQIRATLHYGTLEGMPEWGVSVRLTAHQMTLLARYLRESPIATPPTFDIESMRASWQPPDSKHAEAKPDSAHILTLLHDARKVLIVDPRLKKIVSQTSIKFAPYDVLQDHEIWVLTREGWIVQIDSQTTLVRTNARAGYEPAAMALVHARDSGGESTRHLAVTTVSPPGISYFNAESLEPVKRIDTPEPMGVIIGKQKAEAVVTRHRGCVYPLEGLELAESCIIGVPYPRYATQVPNTPYYLLVGETGEIAVYDVALKGVVARLNLDSIVAPSRGAFVQQPDYGQVFMVASMTSPGILVIGADPTNQPERAWQLLEVIEAETSGALFVASHESSDLIIVDSPANPSDPGSVQLIRRSGGKPTQLPVALELGLEGTPRALQPIFNQAGTEVWLTVWNRADKKSALVVIDPKASQIKSVIMDNLLTTPIRSFWIDLKKGK